MLQELPLSVAYSTKEGFMNIYKIYNSYAVHCEVMCYMTQGILRYGKPKFLKIIGISAPSLNIGRSAPSGADVTLHGHASQLRHLANNC